MNALTEKLHSVVSIDCTLQIESLTRDINRLQHDILRNLIPDAVQAQREINELKKLRTQLELRQKKAKF